MGRPRRKVGLADQQGAARKDYARQRGTPHRHSSPDGSDLPLQGQDRPGRRDNHLASSLAHGASSFIFVDPALGPDPRGFCYSLNEGLSRL